MLVLFLWMVPVSRKTRLPYWPAEVTVLTLPVIYHLHISSDAPQTSTQGDSLGPRSASLARSSNASPLPQPQYTHCPVANTLDPRHLSPLLVSFCSLHIPFKATPQASSPSQLSLFHHPVLSPLPIPQHSLSFQDST